MVVSKRGDTEWKCWSMNAQEYTHSLTAENDVMRLGIFIF